VQSVERAFALLEAIARAGRPLGVSELSTLGGLSPGTTHRLLRTLVDLGYVRQERARSYALGAGFIRLGEQAAAGLGSWTRPLLEEVAAELGESVNLAALEGDHVVYLAHVPSPRSMRMFTEVGSRVPVHSTGVGKAMLAQLDRGTVEAIVTRTGMAAATERTLTEFWDLDAELDLVEDRGYALDEQEQEDGVRCVAVAVPGGGTHLAVSVSGPVSRMTRELVLRAVELLRAVAARIDEETRGQS
jgi:IclR family transcriptional regulator, acetate operon repressor